FTEMKELKRKLLAKPMKLLVNFHLLVAASFDDREQCQRVVHLVLEQYSRWSIKGKRMFECLWQVKRPDTQLCMEIKEEDTIIPMDDAVRHELTAIVVKGIE